MRPSAPLPAEAAVSTERQENAVRGLPVHRRCSTCHWPEPGHRQTMQRGNTDFARN
jgi:cytochrome c2